MSLINALIVLAIIVFVIARRLAGEPLEARRLFLMPVLLGAYGVYQLTNVHDVHHLALDVALLAIGGIVALIGGVIRGRTIKIYVRDGHLWSRYTWVTIGVWVALIALRLGQSLVDRMLGADTAVLTAALAFMAALSLLGEAAVVGLSALRSGTPFAPRRSRGDFAARGGRFPRSVSSRR